jgi:hypothetical protein
MWRRSNYVVLPFAGGSLEQPWWIRKDFLTLDLLRQYNDIQADKPNTDHLTDPYEEYD